ncbi:MAG: M23 family metallopeptidase [Clostridia bacterium]
MFKKFFQAIIIFIVIISFVNSFSNNTTSNKYTYPIKNNNTISSDYGYRILFNKKNFHNGIDIPAVINTKIYAIDTGVITYIGFDYNGYGNYLIILHNNGYKSLYGHLSEKALVKLGDKVNNGDLIALVGPKILTNGLLNGSTTGSHLHFSVFDNTGITFDPKTLY